MADEEKPKYKVGYGLPPKETQFKKGDRGNPHGRPKGSKNLSTLVHKIAHERVKVNGNRSMTMLEVSLRQVAKKAANGDARAFREFVSLVQLIEGTMAGIAPSADIGIGEADQATFDNFVRRLKDAGPAFQAHTEPLSAEPSKKPSTDLGGKN